ncbi:MAG: peroxiredoxin-like family protein [Pseudomonadota bacterium]
MRALINLTLLLLVISGFAVAPAAKAGDVPKRAEDVQPLPVGASAPDFSVRTAAGDAFVFDADAVTQPTLLIFYRGGWCPYCNRHLQELQTVVPKLRAEGYEVLFLSADRPELLYKSLDEPDIDYTLLSDAAMTASRAFGLAFEVDAPTVKRYKEFGIDLEASSGFDHHQLPVPAVYLIGAGGTVEFMFSDPDYKKRLEPDALLSAAGISAGD